MSAPGLAAWLTVAAILFCLGVLAAMARRDRGGVPAGLVMIFAAATVAMAALVRHAVLPAAGLSTLLLILALGGVFVLVIEATSAREDEP